MREVVERPRSRSLVADAVQLYLDCRRACERALEAAEAFREAVPT